MARLLGVDHGEKRFGLAWTDPEQLMARPLEIIEGEPAFWRRLAEILREEEVEAIVLGLPLRLDGSRGAQAEKVLAFKERLEARSDVPVWTWDERLTSVEAGRLLGQRGGSRGDGRGRRDALAAHVLLQGYLRFRQLGGCDGGAAGEEAAGSEAGLNPCRDCKSC